MMSIQALNNGYVEKIPSLQLLLLSMVPYGMEYPFGQLRSAALSVPPPSLFSPQAYSLLEQIGKQ